MNEYRWTEDMTDEEALKVFKEMQFNDHLSIEDLTIELYNFGFRSNHIDTVKKVLELSDEQTAEMDNFLKEYEKQDRAEAQEYYDNGYRTWIDSEGVLKAGTTEYGACNIFFAVKEYLAEIQKKNEGQEKEHLQKIIGNMKHKVELSFSSAPSTWNEEEPSGLDEEWVTFMKANICDDGVPVARLYAEIGEPDLFQASYSKQEFNDRWQRFDVEAYFILKGAIIDQAQSLGIPLDQLQWPDAYGLDKYQSIDEYLSEKGKFSSGQITDFYTLRYPLDGKVIEKKVEAPCKTIAPKLMQL